ncbi:uncharacterized protein QC764_705900 [Podospora pseudoanserina]|uniref:Uncharacterized protein n=1 Tax=Podospora pseudoanserina TaxID=2609844 RepID=A0ABR0HJH3_9PEZI|nr:hypothetical protein QC764_705900 [Podospora pseudoanserina]
MVWPKLCTVNNQTRNTWEKGKGSKKAQRASILKLLPVTLQRRRLPANCIQHETARQNEIALIHVTQPSSPLFFSRSLPPAWRVPSQPPSSQHPERQLTIERVLSPTTTSKPRTTTPFFPSCSSRRKPLNTFQNGRPPASQGRHGPGVCPVEQHANQSLQVLPLDPPNRLPHHPLRLCHPRNRGLHRLEVGWRLGPPSKAQGRSPRRALNVGGQRRGSVHLDEKRASKTDTKQAIRGGYATEPFLGCKIRMMCFALVTVDMLSLPEADKSRIYKSLPLPQ